MVFCVLFSVTLKHIHDGTAFLKVFKKLQGYCRINEPGTLTCELHGVRESETSNDLKYLVLQRFNSRRDFEEVHRKSAAFADFIDAVRALDVEEERLELFDNSEVQLHLEERIPHMPIEEVLEKGVLVFAGARPGARAVYAEAAAKLGVYIALTLQVPLIYGGGTVGLMGCTAQAAKLNNGKVVAVIPTALCPQEASGAIIGDLVYYTRSMSERKSIMFAHANMVIALPGGAGTFDEVLEVLTLFQLNAYRPKIGLLNVNGFFEPFLALLRHLVTEGFLEQYVFSFLVVQPTVETLIEALEQYVPPASAAATLVWHHRP